MTLCSHCGKHLLSQASACCNWCGAEISDADYQARAQAEREAYFRHAAAHDAQSLAATGAIYGFNAPLNPFTLAPMTGYHHAAQDAIAGPPSMPKEPQRSTENSEPVKNEAEEAGERFRHLEF